MKKKIIIFFIACLICLFTISDIGSMESGYVYVVVRDRFYNPITYAYVSLDNISTIAQRGVPSSFVMTEPFIFTQSDGMFWQLSQFLI